MPTYQYRCKSCSFELEEIQKFTDDPLVTCPSCKENALVRIIGGAGLVFKGSGFYLTDYKQKSSAEASSGPAKPKPSADSSGSSESKTPPPAAPPAKGGDGTPSAS